MISVIVPIYNSCKYISQCIESILSQSFKDFEVLLVDDGSTDNTSLICKNYAKKDNRVKYFYKKNSGVSDSRNFGLDRACGKYIVFIDSDDFFCEDTLFEKCVKLANDFPSSLIAFNFKFFNPDNTYINHKSFKLENANSINDIISCCIAPIKLNLNVSGAFRAVWGKFFDRAIIEQHNIRFDKKMHYSEDEIFLISYLKNANKVVDANIYGLSYRNLPNSLSRGYIKDLSEQSTLKLINIVKLYNNSFDNLTIKTALYEFIWQIYFSIYKNEKLIESNSKYICKEWLKNNKDILKFKIDKTLITKSTKAYFWCYKIMPIFLQLINRLRYKILENK